VPLIGEPDRDPAALVRPQLLDQAVVELAVPLAVEELDDLAVAVEELGAVTPATVLGIGEGDALRVPSVPGILGEAYLLRGGLGGERR
jgi:hypothetical protein